MPLWREKMVEQKHKCLGFKHLHPVRTGLTLVEVMMAVSVIVIAALGTLCYEYLCVDHVHIARAQLTATRIGQLLIEDWKSTGGALDYSPEDLNMGFALPPEPSPGEFVTTVDGLPLFISTNRSEVDKDDSIGTKLYEIEVSVRWKKDFSDGVPADDDPAVILTTYVRRDQ
jgi:prepilin-type N-terminal cleavage/methylation domain-containing protein